MRLLITRITTLNARLMRTSRQKGLCPPAAGAHRKPLNSGLLSMLMRLAYISVGLSPTRTLHPFWVTSGWAVIRPELEKPKRLQRSMSASAIWHRLRIASATRSGVKDSNRSFAYGGERDGSALLLGPRSGTCVPASGTRMKSAPPMESTSSRLPGTP
jgi:hypothetical protein